MNKTLNEILDEGLNEFTPLTNMPDNTRKLILALMQKAANHTLDSIKHEIQEEVSFYGVYGSDGDASEVQAELSIAFNKIKTDLEL